MKQKFLLKTMLLLSALIAGSGSVWAEEVVAYTLTPTSGSNNNYAGNCDITISSITWNLEGNSQQIPWRIGGKSLSGVNRNVYSKTAMGSAISKVELTVGAASSITVNSLKLIVASDASFTNQIDEVSKTFAANSTITFTPTDGDDWATGAYYKFVFNVSVSGTSNKFVEFNNAKFYKESGSSGPVQLDAPELTATAGNGLVTLEWDEISNASSYTIQYADNASFTGATTLTNATSPEEISGLTNGTTYYFKAMAVGDETNYLSSDYGDAVSATPANVSKITITQNDLTNFTNSYDWYEWTAGGVSGKAYAYKNNGMQFNSGKDGYWIYNTSAIPGTITSVKIVKASGTDRSWTLRAGTSAISTTDGGTQIGSAQTVGTSGATWNVEGSYKYFCLIVSGGSTVISSIEITYIPSTDPVISASDVDITYDATSGSIDYTLENATGNVSATITSGDWLTLGTITADEVPFTCAANTGAERTATVTLSFSGADDKVVTVTQAASPARYTTISDLFAGATSTATDVLVTFNNWVVSGVSTNGKNVFVTDNNGNGFVIYSSSDQSGTYAVGNILSGTAVPCSLKLNSGYAQLTNLDAADLSISTGGTVTAANVAMASLAGVNTGALVSYNNLTCTVDASTYTLTDGTTTIQLYTSLYNYTTTPDFVNGHKYNVTGIYQQYGETKELLPRSSEDIVEVFTPAISVTPASLTSFTYEVDNGPSTTKIISVTGENLSADITLSLGNNSDFEMSTTEGSGYTNSITLTQSNGTVAATTVYVRLKAGLEIGNSYSGTITLTSTGATDASVSLSGSVTEPVVDYATLPFMWAGGSSSDLTALNGVTANSLGSSDYAAQHVPYLVKLDGTGDYIQIKTNEQPNRVYIGVKMAGGANTSTITIQASSDGSSFDDGEKLTISGSQNDVVHLVSTRTFDSSVRYIKLYFTKGSNVGVGPISIIAGSSVPATVNAYGYGTFASGFPLDFSNVSNVSAWQITGVSGENITFSQITGTIASATGVLLKREADGDINIPVAASGTDLSSTNKLEGLTGYKTVTANAYYGLSGQTFVKVNAGDVPAGKALLPASALSSSVKAFTFVFEDDATGIEETLSNSPLKGENIYNLAGQMVNGKSVNGKLPKGIYIVNGKKVLK